MYMFLMAIMIEIRTCSYLDFYIAVYAQEGHEVLFGFQILGSLGCS
jgi:hypothetical protein